MQIASPLDMEKQPEGNMQALSDLTFRAWQAHMTTTRMNPRKGANNVSLSIQMSLSAISVSESSTIIWWSSWNSSEIAVSQTFAKTNFRSPYIERDANSSVFSPFGGLWLHIRICSHFQYRSLSLAEWRVWKLAPFNSFLETLQLVISRDY